MTTMTVTIHNNDCDHYHPYITDYEYYPADRQKGTALNAYNLASLFVLCF
jgi:hypothetical protein